MIARWEQGRATIDALLTDRRLERVAPSGELADGLLEQAGRLCADLRLGDSSPAHLHFQPTRQTRPTVQSNTMSIGGIGGGFGAQVGRKIGEGIVARRGARLAAENRIQCDFRVLAGGYPGLSTKWSFGEADLSRGSITYTAAKGHLRGRWREPITIFVSDIDMGSLRKPTFKELLRVNATDCFVRVSANGAVLEWKVLEARLAWAKALVQPPLDER